MNAVAGHGLDAGSAWQTMPADLELKVQGERVIGPVHGFHLACYAIESAAGFYGYAKVYGSRPAGVWTRRAALAKYTAGPFASSEQAMQGVIVECSAQLGERDTRANRLFRFVWKLL